MVDPKDPTISIVKQCILLFISRSGVYYQPASESELDLQIMLEIDKYFTKNYLKKLCKTLESFKKIFNFAK